MERRNFIRTSCIACIGGITMSALLQSCGSLKTISAPIQGSDLIVPLFEFHKTKKNSTAFKKYIVVQNDQLQYPICIYRFSENNYSALLMRCTHQGTELQVFGDKLQCPAHGSEFSNKGIAFNAPAVENLRTFPLSIKNDQLIISLV